VESFTRRKTIRVFQHAFPRADCIAVDLHLAYYRNRTFLERLRNDVILPARESGFDPVWLMGISMGGMGALFYLRDHPGEIDGVIVLAPFLGDDALIEEIERAGGPRAWSPPSPANADFQENLWRWLRRFSPDDPPPIFLAYGTGDRFHRAQRMLASLLPSTRTISIPGKHRWDTWTKLWKKIVPRFRDEWNRGA
jgi:pimeloyl-ACP methyl ester carboxylesterase